MRRATLLVAALALSSCGPGLVQTGDLKDQLCDPGSTQVDRITDTADKLYGYVNARTPQGGYAGAVPFVVDKASGHAQLLATGWAGDCGQPDPQAELDAHLALLDKYERNAR